MRPVSVDILTGFLGSGKTTLLSHALAGRLAGHKVAVVMNEIGEIGIDGRVVTGLDYVESMVELTSGCICCTIDDYRFDLAIQELRQTVDPTLIVIETTGLADPEPTAYRVRQCGLGLDAVITMVDAAHAERALAETEIARRQVEAADFLVLNKIDLVAPLARARLARRLRRINRRALLLACERGRVAADLLFATAAGERRAPAERPADGAHLEHEAMGSFSYRSEGSMDLQRFERFLAGLPGGIYRAKGFARLTGNAWSCLFNYTCGRYELNWIKLGANVAETQAVFIGRDVERVRERVLRDLSRCETG